ncbi:YdcF family protein [Starkeya koreensis]|uniref:YdcF family protein n=1 Tax=Ancylobacter koreensis TaxID=266121 RepID=A0ABT0DH28_9HYPH|nr:YdcF family protein [Ancylobacter koreensis]
MTEVPSTETGARPAPRRRRLRLALLAVALVAGALLAGFAAFVAGIDGREAQTPRRADGIVVLTGTPDRIVEATNLLIEGRGKRLLITGVHPDTTLAGISRTVPATQEALACCVELGRSALNTRGNALEAADWARANHFRSLLVVTSAWHMPRALVELNRTLPDVELVPYPVVPNRPAEASWTDEFAKARLLAVEYVKFLAAYAGVRLWPATASQLGENAGPAGP